MSIFVDAIKMLFLALIFLCKYFYFRLIKSDSRSRLIGRLLRDYFIAMGPLYIKVGQIMATRKDLISEKTAEELSDLQDTASAMSEEATRSTLLSTLPDSLDNIFSEFDYSPIASASIAQVHLARLHTGEKVAVKIVKKGVEKKLKSSLYFYKFLFFLSEKFSGAARQASVCDRFEELAYILLGQTDMIKELEQQESVRKNFEGHRFVNIPRAYPEFSSKGVLVMEYIDRISGRKLDYISCDRKRLARRLQDAIYTMLYMHGKCHGDPHPGNVFFDFDGGITFVDFGITVDLTEDEKWGLSSFYYACVRKEWVLAVSRFTEHFVEDKDNIFKNWSDYQEKMSIVLKRHFQDNSSHWSTISYFRDVNEILKFFGAKYTATFTKVELVFLSVEGFASIIDPSIDIWENARVFTDRYSPYMSSEIKSRLDLSFAQLIPSSLRLREKAESCLVAPTHIHRYFFPSAYPVFVEKAEGAHIFDVDGNCFVDLSGGYGPHILGYNHPVIRNALREGVDSGVINALGHREEILFAEKLVSAFCGSEKAILCNSGTEACLKAIRLARAYSRKTRVVKFEGHYHGWSDQGMVSSWFRFSGGEREPAPIEGCKGTDPNVVMSTLVFQYGDIEALAVIEGLASDIACVICEPMPSSIAKVDERFLRDLRSCCSRSGIILIFDEVVTGFRVCYGGVQTIAGVMPDLTALGKIIGGGLPCGAVVGRENIIDVAKSSEDPFFDYDNKAFVGGTMSGNSLTCKAGVAVLSELGSCKGYYDDLYEKSEYLMNEMRSIASRLDIDCFVDGGRSIFSLMFGHRKSSVYRKKQAGSNFKATIALAYYMRKEGVYMPELHSFMISMAHSYRDIDVVLGAFEKSLVEMSGDGFFVN